MCQVPTHLHTHMCKIPSQDHHISQCHPQARMSHTQRYPSRENSTACTLTSCEVPSLSTKRCGRLRESRLAEFDFLSLRPLLRNPRIVSLHSRRGLLPFFRRHGESARGRPGRRVHLSAHQRARLHVPDRPRLQGPRCRGKLLLVEWVLSSYVLYMDNHTNN